MKELRLHGREPIVVVGHSNNGQLGGGIIPYRGVCSVDLSSVTVPFGFPIRRPPNLPAKRVTGWNSVRSRDRTCKEFEAFGLKKITVEYPIGKNGQIARTDKKPP